MRPSKRNGQGKLQLFSVSRKQTTLYDNDVTRSFIQEKKHDFKAKSFVNTNLLDLLLLILSKDLDSHMPDTIPLMSDQKLNL